ncbi:hypothetical protein [Clostridium intestinale]|uniref:RES domain-containing protein n=1 Tax=Clostridium intestinale DSM 6191 TaxID=1121320 RepID=A0A1M6AM98_9CLOT|nr:hypothetical protein [Clostridium intestinale]SHI37551.1 hypothetical protein SAMN02745941_03703 [Clostridium intestinale DSM 6191]
MCIICFLSDNSQYLLRHSAMIRSDRLEHTLDNYKNEFKSYFIEKINSDICLEYNTESNIYIKTELAKLNYEEIDRFFEKIKSIYINWINTEIESAIKKMEDLVALFSDSIFEDNLNSKLLFRGRISKGFISHWDMFHIPFNRRFLIDNQRYSLIGQPILYFSSSPYGVYKELGTYKDLRISRFFAKSDSSFRIFENINKFEKYIKIVSDKKINSNYNITVNQMIENLINGMVNNDEIMKSDTIKNMLFSMILSSCCSFPRREDTKESTFSEEYILPQILTIVLKKMKYKGIKYISTKLYDDLNIIKQNDLPTIMYSNYCIFTDYKEDKSREKTYVYDRDLYNCFDLSNPISFHEKVNDEFYDIKALILLIKEIDEDDNIDDYLKNISYEVESILKILEELRYKSKDVSSKDKISKKNNNNDEYKAIEDFVNLHILFIRNVLLNIKNKEV